MHDLGPRPLLGYISNRLDRATERRDDGSLAALDAQAGAYLIGGELIVMRQGDQLDPLFALADARALAPAHEAFLLGLADGAPRYGFGIDQSAAEALKSRSDLVVID